MINQSICLILLFALKKICNHKHKNTGKDKLSFCIIGRCTIDIVRKDACQYHHPSRYPISQFTFLNGVAVISIPMQNQTALAITFATKSGIALSASHPT